MSDKIRRRTIPVEEKLEVLERLKRGDTLYSIERTTGYQRCQIRQWIKSSKLARLLTPKSGIDGSMTTREKLAAEVQEKFPVLPRQELPRKRKFAERHREKLEQDQQTLPRKRKSAARHREKLEQEHQTPHCEKKRKPSRSELLYRDILEYEEKKKI